MNIQYLFSFVSQVYGKGFYKKIHIIVLLSLLCSGAQLVSAWFLGATLDGVDQGLEAVLQSFWIICAASITYVLINAAVQLLSGRMTNRFTKNLRNRLGAKLCRADYTALEACDEGGVLSVVTNDIKGFAPGLQVLYTAGQLPVKLVLVCVLLWSISWKLFLAVLPAIPIAILPSLILSGKLHSMYREEKEAMGKCTGFLMEAVNFVVVLKAFCLETQFGQRNRKILSALEKARRRRLLREQVILTLGRCLGHIVNPLIFIFGGYLVIQGEMTVGQIFTVIFLIGHFGEGLNLLYAIPSAYQEAKTSGDRVGRILELSEEEGKEEAETAMSGEHPMYSFYKASFAYAQQRVVEDLSFCITSGEKIAVVGESGSGKSTLLKLLSGLYRASHGIISFCGRDISDFPAEELRSYLSVVTQDTFLFPGTIRDNLLLARPSATHEEMERACRAAHIHDLIISMEKQYDTLLGSLTTPLSKGQIQRLNLARAFLRDGPVLLLDEPTSALDPSIQEEISRYILEEVQEKTVVLITHDLSGLDQFDRVLVLDKGRVAGFDTNAALRGKEEVMAVLSVQEEEGEGIG